MKELRLTIDLAADATMSIDAVGFEGDACLRAIEELLEDLADVVKIDRKPESDRPARRRTGPVRPQERS